MSEMWKVLNYYIKNNLTILVDRDQFFIFLLYYNWLNVIFLCVSFSLWRI